jgi:hypothetical protein
MRYGIAPHSRPRHYMGVSGQRHAPAALYPRERDPVPTGQEAGWATVTFSAVSQFLGDIPLTPKKTNMPAPVAALSEE